LIAKPFTDYTQDDYAAVTGVNLTGFFRITQLAIGFMLQQSGGHVVQITTSLVDHANSALTVVLASLTKGGLNAATKALAIEYATRGIGSNAVALGAIKTPMHPAERHDARAAGSAAWPGGNPPSCRSRSVSGRRSGWPGSGHPSGNPSGAAAPNEAGTRM
jgi:NAD(P)-dependent dehydrogenase (short-subunit alcohol dehydrogenase family)